MWQPPMLSSSGTSTSTAVLIFNLDTSSPLHWPKSQEAISADIGYVAAGERRDFRRLRRRNESPQDLRGARGSTYLLMVALSQRRQGQPQPGADESHLAQQPFDGDRVCLHEQLAVQARKRRVELRR